MLANGFLKLLQKYKWNSVFFKNIVLSVLLILVPIIIVGIIIFSYNVHISKKELQTFADNLHDQIQKTWTDINSSIYNIHAMTDSSIFMETFLYSDNYFKDSETAQNINIMREILSNAVSSSQYISSIYLYNQKNDYIVSTNGSGKRSMFWDLSWFSTETPEALNFYGFTRIADNGSNTKKRYITIIKPIVLNGHCYAIYNIDYDVLLSALADSNSVTSNIYIVTPQNKVILSKNSDDLGKDISQINNFFDNTRNNFINISSTDSYNYKLYTQTQKISNSIYKSFGLVIIILTFLLLISSFFTAFHITNSFYKSIRNILAKIPQDIVPFSENSKTNNNEFEYINSVISSLIVKNYNFEEELASQLSKLKNAQMIALQEQINPHFIFNTLNIINLINLSEQKENPLINKVVLLMSDILRYILNTEKYLVPLEEELKYLKKYIDLQNIKYDGSFKVKWDVSDDVKQLFIVKLSLQPLVENAISHGFVRKSNANILLISAKSESNKLVICIHNNGKPIDPDKLKNIQKKLKSDTMVSGNHIGLFNINLRYKLLFGSDYKCTIESDNVSGTDIKLFIPKTNTLKPLI